MTSRHLIAAAGAALALALSGTTAAQAAVDAACLVELPVRFESSGQIVPTAPGRTRCAGRVGSASVDPGVVTPAKISGSARAGLNGCAPVPQSGRLALSPIRLIGFEADRTVRFEGAWRAAEATPVTTITGAGSAAGTSQGFNGALRFAPASPACAGAPFAPGILQLEIALSPQSKSARRSRRGSRR